MASRSTTQAGSWSSTTTWSGAAKPISGDTVTLNHAVTLDEAADIGTSAPGNVALTINAAFVAADDTILRLRGHVAQSNGVSVTLHGCSVIFDQSLAPANTAFDWKIGQDYGGTTILTIRGTSSARCRVETVAGGKNGRFTNGNIGIGTGQIDSEYADFLRIGDFDRQAFEPVLDYGGIFRFSHCNFYRCGTIQLGSAYVHDGGGSAGGGSTISFDHCVSIESQSTYSFKFLQGSVTYCDFDRWPFLTTSIASGVGNLFRVGYYDPDLGGTPAAVGPFPATFYSLTGPIGGVPSVASSDFTVAVGGGTQIDGVATFVPTSTAAGTFNPASFPLSTDNLTRTFTFTPSGTADHDISVTVDQQLLRLSEPIWYHSGTDAVSYSLTGPATCVAGRASADFTVSLPAGQSIAAQATITPDDAASGGSFTPSTVNIAASTSGASATFKYTPPSYIKRIWRMIHVSSGGALADPMPFATAAGRSFDLALGVWASSITSTAILRCGGNYVADAAPPNARISIEDANHYDVVETYYNIRDYTADSGWDAAIAAALYQYRDMFVNANGGVTPWHANSEGLRQDYERRGDPLSRDAVFNLRTTGISGEATDPSYTLDWDRSRETAFGVLSHVNAARLGYATTSYTAVLLAHCKDHVLQWIDPTNADHMPADGPECNACQVFMMGLTLRALIAYWDVYRDAEIPTLVKDACDWLWANAWFGEGEGLAFPYWVQDMSVLSALPKCAGRVGHDYDHDTPPSPDPVLSGMVGPAFAWVSLLQSDPDVAKVYRERYEDILRGGVASGGENNDQALYTPKQFNQNHLWEEEALSWRARTITPLPGSSLYTLSPPSAITGEANRPSPPFTVSLEAGTEVADPVTVTPHDGSAGGTFIPPTAILTTERPYGAFRYAPHASADGTGVAITVTNDRGLPNPSGFTYTVSGVAAFATGCVVTMPATSNNAYHYSPEWTVRLDPVGSVPPRSADVYGGTILFNPDSSDGYTAVVPAQIFLSAEIPSGSFRIFPLQGSRPSTVVNSVDIHYSVTPSITVSDAQTYYPTPLSNQTTPLPGEDPEASQATTYLMTPPTPASGPVGEASGPFVISLPSGTYSDPDSGIVVKPDDGGDGGTFIPPYIWLLPDSPSEGGSFTYTPATGLSRLISVHNGLSGPAGGANGVVVTDPAPVIYEPIGTAAATGYNLTGPSSGWAEVESMPFTITLTPIGGTHAGITITPTDGGGGGTFAPTSVYLTTSAPSGQFTYVPPWAGTWTLHCTNDAGFADLAYMDYEATELPPPHGSMGRARMTVGAPGRISRRIY